MQNLEKELSEFKDIDSRNLLDNIDRGEKELEEIRRQQNWRCLVEIKSEMGRIWRKTNKLFFKSGKKK